MTGVTRSRLTREARAEQLLDVAERLFCDHGFEGTSIGDVSAAAGVTRPVIYAHYASKNELYLACVRRVRAGYHAALLAAAAESDPLEQLRRGADAYYGLLERDRGRWELLFGSAGLGSAELVAELDRERQVTITLLADLLRQHAPGMGQEELEVHAHALSGAGEQIGRWWTRHPDVPRARVVELHVRAVWGGAQARHLEQAAAGDRNDQGGTTAASTRP